MIVATSYEWQWKKKNNINNGINETEALGDDKFAPGRLRDSVPTPGYRYPVMD